MMTGTSYYPASDYPPAVSRGPAGTPDASGPVLVAVAGPAAQSRATVAFRLILAVPHFFVLYLLGIVASVVAVIGWLGALVTGRLPGFAATYLSGYVGWYCRVGAYLLLLTGAYPPFSFSGGDYPVRVTVNPGRLNRLTVLIRLVLAIPAAVVSMVLVSGVTTIVALIAWLAALGAGRLPGSLHQAFAAVLRYAVRYCGYVYLVTGAYPSGLFGDRPGIGPAQVAPSVVAGYGPPAPGYGPAQGYGPGYGPAQGYGPSSYGQPPEPYRTPGYGPRDHGTTEHETAGYLFPPPARGSQRIPGYPAAAYEASGQAASRELVLSAAAKRLVGLILALGVLTVAGAGVAAAAGINSAIQRDRAISRLNAAIVWHNTAVAEVQRDADQVDRATAQLKAANARLGSALDSDGVDACTTIGCFDASNVADAQANVAFGRALRAISFPAGAAAAAHRLVTAVAADERAWMYMSRSVSFTEGVDRSARAVSAGKKVAVAYSALTKMLQLEAAELDQKAAALDREAVGLDSQAAVLNVPARILTPQSSSSPAAT